MPYSFGAPFPGASNTEHQQNHTPSKTVVDFKPPQNYPKSMRRAKLYTDGGSRGNPGKSAFGYLIINKELEDDRVLEADQIGIATNNQAEYTALIRGLEKCRELGVEEVDVFSDSLLMVSQMRQEWNIKNSTIKTMRQKALVQQVKFKRVDYNWVPREDNYITIVDAEVNAALDLS